MKKQPATPASKSSSGLDSASALTDIDELYTQLLSQTLTAPDVIHSLLRAQSPSGKRKFIQFHHNFLQTQPMQIKSSRSRSSYVRIWSERDRECLNILQQSQEIDFFAVVSLKMSLSTASKDFIHAFCSHQGLLILMRVMLKLLNRSEITIKDAAMLFECLLCVKCVMNHATGLHIALEETQGLLDVIAMCCLFQHKPLSLLVSYEFIFVFFNTSTYLWNHRHLRFLQ